MTKHRVHYPHEISRFTGLEGGQYGTADLVALTRNDLEFRLGGDYVEFTRARAVELRDAIDRFLCLDREDEHERHEHHRRRDDERVVIEEKIDAKVEIVEPARERGTRRKRA